MCSRSQPPLSHFHVKFSWVHPLLVARASNESVWLLTEYGSTIRDDEKNWEPLTNRTAEWEIPRVVQEQDQNWAGLQKMRNHRAVGSLWWDERAERYFISKLEESQFPADCSQAHWIAHPEWPAGILLLTLYPCFVFQNHRTTSMLQCVDILRVPHLFGAYKLPSRGFLSVVSFLSLQSLKTC